LPLHTSQTGSANTTREVDGFGRKTTLNHYTKCGAGSELRFRSSDKIVHTHWPPLRPAAPTICTLRHPALFTYTRRAPAPHFAGHRYSPLSTSTNTLEAGRLNPKATATVTACLSPQSRSRSQLQQHSTTGSPIERSPNTFHVGVWEYRRCPQTAGTSLGPTLFLPERRMGSEKGRSTDTFDHDSFKLAKNSGICPTSMFPLNPGHRARYSSAIIIFPKSIQARAEDSNLTFTFAERPSSLLSRQHDLHIGFDRPHPVRFITHAPLKR